MRTFSKRPNESIYEFIRCPVCGGTDFRRKWNLERYAFSRCTNCGLLMQNPQPRAADLIQRYDREYFEYEIENAEPYFQLMLLALKDVNFFSELEPAAGAPDCGEGARSFLDIGCATGTLLAYLKTRGWKEKGVEVCVPAAEYARDVRGVDVHSGTLQEADLQASSFDVVHASHLIEHLNQPGVFVRDVFRILKPGGRILLTTPNSSGFQARLFSGAWRSAIADHMFLFSKQTLSRLLERNGFEIEKIRTWGGIAAGMAPVPVKRVCDSVVKKTGWGDVMIIRARKPA